MKRYLCAVVPLLLLFWLPTRYAYHPISSRKGILLWQVQLSPDQCGSPQWTPCYNVYAVNDTHGDLVWFAFTTSSAAVKGMYLGRHSVYYTTWSGPGLYAVNPTNGHVRWQFPLDNWFRYWVKDIDLDRSASFGTSAEVRDYVYATATGPPARLYGVRTKSGSRQWEYKLPQPAAALADVAGPLEDSKGRGTVFVAVTQASSNSSWVAAVETATGRVAWQSEGLNSTQLDRVELQQADGRPVVLATNASEEGDGGGLVALDAADGSVLWSRAGGFCRTPSPIQDVYKGQLLLSQSCKDLSGLTAVDAVTGQELWAGWEAPSGAQPLGNCSGYSQAAGTIVFGCSCSAKAHWHWTAAAAGGREGAAVAASSPHAGSSSSRGLASAASAAAAAAAAAGAQGANGVCLYALSSRSGRVRWVLPLPGNASFPEGAQAWGMGPLLAGQLAVFLGADRVLAADLLSGKLRWSLMLPRGERLRAGDLPAVDADSNTLLLTAQVEGANKTGVSVVSLREGRLLWHRAVNGSVQRGVRQPSDGVPAAALLVSGGRVFLEACRGSRCCLRALNVTTGKQRWGMCLDAVPGDDATHPHAQFAIWFITLLTIVSIALLILGAGLVYIQRWSEERRILYGAAAPSSPRHSYQPLPPRASDSDDG